jgi:hypothetical protein
MPHDKGKVNQIIALALAIFFIAIIVPASMVMLVNQDMNAGAKLPPVQLTANSYIAVVTHPTAFGMDNTNWNITVYMIPHGSPTNATYNVTVYVNDLAGHNISGTHTVVAKNDHQVYGNITMASHASIENVANATYYVKMTIGGVTVASYTGTVGIMDSVKVNDMVQVIVLLLIPALAAITLALIFLPKYIKGRK